MTSVTEVNRHRPAPALGTFERYLTVWVALCIIAGVVLGQLMPAPFQALGRMNVAEVNIPVALLIWLMIVPMLLKVDFGALHRVAEQWRGIAVTVGVNWLVKPFSMALLGWLFIGWMFRSWLPAGQIDSYIAGLILLAAAPCTAMVFVWSNLTNGEPNFTLRQVALNDTIMVFAFAPIVGLLLGLSSITVPWQTLFLSGVLYIVVPVIAAQPWGRSLLAAGGGPAAAAMPPRVQPVSPGAPRRPAQRRRGRAAHSGQSARHTAERRRRRASDRAEPPATPASSATGRHSRSRPGSRNDRP